MEISNNKAQNMIEYTIVLGIIAAAFVVMNPLMKRGIQAMIRITADQIGNQQGAEQTFNDLERGQMDDYTVSTRAITEKETAEFLGEISYTFDDSMSTDSVTYSNLGFVEDN
jgi:Flp pilus assembly pilin Flp